MQKAIQQNAKKTANHLQGYRTKLLRKISGVKIRTEIASESARQTLAQNWRKLPARVAHCAPMEQIFFQRQILDEIWRRDRKNVQRDAKKPILRKTASRTNKTAPVLLKNGFVLMRLRFTPCRRQLTAFPGLVLEITSSYGGIWGLLFRRSMESPRIPHPRTTDSRASETTRACLHSNQFEWV